ncbi:MAG: PilN domain-containing protein [Candidatus Calescibacterium sp.]|nr:PilN domain-containing protein [Candidatus Calescibacterium sp.]MDW8132113.1 PilN domain-containing protein [Candidatus Calescibacterium sp.]
MGIVIVEQDKRINWGKEIAIILVIFVMISIAYIIPYFMAQKKIEEIKLVKQQVEKLVEQSKYFQNQLPTIENNIKKIKVIYNELNTLRLVLNESILQRFILIEIPHVLPTEAWMTNLSINFDAKTATFGVNIVGTRDKVLQNSAQLLDNISNSPIFKNPKVTGISLQEQEGEVVSNFNVEVNFDYSLDIMENYYKNMK